MAAHDVVRRLMVDMTVLVLAAGCAGTASPAPTPTSTPAPKATATATLAPTKTPTPTAKPASTIGEPADDGARIIAVESPVTVARRVQAGADFVDASPVPTTRTRDLTIDSPAVGGIVHVRLLVPSRFDAQPTTRWPVLYLLGGQSGTYDGWTVYLDAEALTAPTDLLVVMPDQGADDPNGSSFTDWWNGGKGGPRQWETFHLVELRQLLERNWHAGDKRAIAGPSAGGFGAMEYAARQPGLFRFAGSFSGGGLHEYVGPNSGPEPYDKWGDPVDQASIWKAHDPYVNAEALRGTALFVAYGNGEPGPLDDYAISPWDPDGGAERYCGADSAAFVERLKELKIPVTVFAYGNGTHGAAYFRRDLQQSLPLILKAVGT
jgi:diacylglycerol O-acyltransferase/trehalose O-mycolyltransferase